MNKDQEFRDWAIQQSLPVFYRSSFLIIVFVNAFHWIMPLISEGVYDSLPTRIWTSLPALLLLILVLAISGMKKFVIEFQGIQISSLVVGCIWVTGMANFHPYYMTASLLVIVGAALTLITMAQVWWMFVAGLVTIVLFYLVGPPQDTFFSILYYSCCMMISCLLAWVKVRAHAQEFLLRKSLHIAIENLRLEKSKSFYQEQLSFVGQLAGNLAHEINTPLAVFHTSLQLMKEKLMTTQSLDASTESLLKSCFDQTQRMKSLVDNLLYFSGKHFQGETKQTAHQLIQSAVSLVKSYSDQKSVRIEMNIDTEEVLLGCSHRDVLQILFHVLKNGIEAASHARGGRDAWVKIITQKSASKGEYEILIVDSGEGIPRDLRSHLFAPFVVGREKKGHIGLGLSTSRSIVDRCGGSIDALNVATNTTIRISLPIQQVGMH